MSETLYERLGGEASMTAVVDEFYDRVVADETVANFFEDVDMTKQRAHQVQFLSAVAGGPVDYTGQEMAAVHEQMAIAPKHFEAIATHLDAALREFDVDAADREAVLAAVEGYRDDVVTIAAD